MAVERRKSLVLNLTYFMPLIWTTRSDKRRSLPLECKREADCETAFTKPDKRYLFVGHMLKLHACVPSK